MVQGRGLLEVTRQSQLIAHCENVSPVQGHGSDCFFPNSELRFLLLRLRQDAEVHNLTVTEVAAAAYDNDIARL